MPARHNYKLNFEYETKVVAVDHSLVPCSIYSFVPFMQLEEHDTYFLVGKFHYYDIYFSFFNDICVGSVQYNLVDYVNFHTDVIGVLTGVGTEREIDRNGSRTKMNVIALDADGYLFFKVSVYMFIIMSLIFFVD